MLEVEWINGNRSNILEEVERLGWAHFTIPAKSELGSFMKLFASTLGVACCMRNGGGILEELVVTSKAEARPKSLSRLHGTGEFPLHTDTAHWTRPCRYLLLGCKKPGASRRATILFKWDNCDLSVEDKSLFDSAVFTIRNGSKSFFGTITSATQDFVRYDQGCMTPANARSVVAEKRINTILGSQKRERIEWMENNMIVIYNWRVLHGRDSSDVSGEGRVLYRILVQ